MTTTEPQTVALDDLATWVATYDAAQAKIKELQQLAEVARRQIEARLGDAEVGTVGGRPVVRWTTVHSSRVDIGKLRESYPDLAAEVTVASEAKLRELGAAKTRKSKRQLSEAQLTALRANAEKARAAATAKREAAR